MGGVRGAGVHRAPADPLVAGRGWGVGPGGKLFVYFASGSLGPLPGRDCSPARATTREVQRHFSSSAVAGAPGTPVGSRTTGLGELTPVIEGRHSRVRPGPRGRLT